MSFKVKRKPEEKKNRNEKRINENKYGFLFFSFFFFGEILFVKTKLLSYCWNSKSVKQSNERNDVVGTEIYNRVEKNKTTSNYNRN
jgi:hypothetical protein